VSVTTRLILTTVAALFATTLTTATAPTPAPEFTHSRADEWVNSPPLTLATLRGKVVMVEFWAFECVNCLNSREWVHSLEQSKSANGLVVVEVHTPELAPERYPDAVRKAVERLSIHDPVMMDQDSSYWSALHVQYWPTFCLIGRDGLLYACVPGEMHKGDPRAAKVEQALDVLLKAPAPAS
jgi:thiol-disulfide isomerase/thioredoxin